MPEFCTAFSARPRERRRWARNRRSLSKITPAKGVEIVTEFRGNGARTAIWKATYVHPTENEPRINWQTQVQVTAYAGAVEFDIELAAGELGFAVAPAAIRPGRPRIVPALVRKFRCAIGGRELFCVPRVIDAMSVPAFVDNDLFSEVRSIPIVMVAPTVGSHGPLVNPETIADMVAGLAETWVIKDEETSFALSDHLPPKFSTYNGAVRIYWPRMKRTDSPFWHPLFLPVRIFDWQGRGLQPEAVIGQRIMRVSSLVHHESPVVQQARAVLIEEMIEEFRRAASRAKTAAELQDRVAELLRLLEEKEATIRTLQEERNDLERSFFEFQREQLAEARGEEGEPFAHELPVLRNTEEALLQARKDFGEVLVVWDSAIDSARKSRSKHTLRVYETFQILAEVAREYFDARDRGASIGGALEKKFRERGAPNYGVKDSETTSSMYGRFRKIRQGEITINFEKHFTLAIASRENCVQIYFHLDDASRRAIIGYCGPHLPHADAN